MRQKTEFLVNDADAGAARLGRMGERHLTPTHPYRPRIRPVDAAQHLEKRRFPRAVFAANGMDLAGPAVKIHPIKRANAGKRLRDVVHF